MKRIKLTEKQFKSIIRNVLLNEVRYINSKDYNEAPIKSTDKIRVYHGCNLQNALSFASNGLSGKELINRNFSYENGMNPNGLFVTTDFKVAKEFGYDKYNCIIEFTASVEDLDTPVWNGSNNFYGQLSNPQSFKDENERNIQKQKYIDKYRNYLSDEYNDYSNIRHSDNPALAHSIFRNCEHQALFFGDVDPNMIKRIWVKNGWNEKSYTPFSTKDFLKTYSNLGEKNLLPEKIYKPNDDFTDWKDYYLRGGTAKIHKTKESLDNAINSFVNNMANANNTIKLSIARRMFPKQIIQAFGLDFFKSNYRYWR